MVDVRSVLDPTKDTSFAIFEIFWLYEYEPNFGFFIYL